MWLRRGARSLLAVFLAAVIVPGGTSGCGGDCDLEIDSTVLADGVVGQPYDQNLDADCGGDAWYLDFGFLPPGISLRSSTGELQGVPARAGVFDFSVAVVDFDHYGYVDDIAYGSFSIVVRNR